MSRGTIGLVSSGAGGVENIRDMFVEPALRRAWQVAVTLTPCAAQWLEHLGERAALERTTGFPVRVQPRLPDEPSVHPPASCYVIAPATANTVAKLALGIADNQALTTACEAVGSQAVPAIVFPRVNAAHARQPAWEGHLAALRSVGVHLVYGEDVWPLHEPRCAPPSRTLPWSVILDTVERVTPSR